MTHIFGAMRAVDARNGLRRITVCVINASHIASIGIQRSNVDNTASASLLVLIALSTLRRSQREVQGIIKTRPLTSALAPSHLSPSA